MTAPPVDTLTDLTGTVVMVTGAARGIGRGIALRLAESGASLALAGRDTAALNAVAEDVGKLGVEAAVVTVDVAVEADVVAAVARVVDHLGHLDGLVNCAGVQPVAPLLDQSVDDWNEMLNVNARGVFLCTREAAKGMIAAARGGSIVNITSIEASQPAWGHSHYNASKAAVLMHTRAAALELGRHGIRVNSVSPGLIWSATLERDWPEGVARWLAHVPLARLGQPDDVADAVLYLLSPMSRFVSGADLVVDGGVLAHPTW